MVQVEMISTGEEVLSGQITDTNASWLSSEFDREGLNMTRRVTVGDRMEDLVACFLERSLVADLIIVNGGLGPTIDDLSSAAAATALNEPLVTRQEWIDEMTAKFQRMNRDMPPGNLKQAELPRSAQIIPNPVGTACGFSIRLNKSLIYFTPGVPHEFKRMISNEILPRIREQFKINTVSLLKRLHCFGIAESHLGTMLAPIELGSGLQLGYRAHLPTLEIKIMAKSENQATLLEDMESAASEIRSIVGANIICEDDHTIESHVQELMIQAGHTLALAESCTGGMIASQIVNVPESSNYFDRGFVTYTNEAKHQMIDVPMEIIQEHGAVSMATAHHMASGARLKAGTSHALAVSGIAGPGGGSEEKPIGTVAYALATPEHVYAQLIRGTNWGRKRIRMVASTLAMDMLRRHLLGLPVFGDFELSNTIQTQTR